MRLYLVRHGKAELGNADDDRHLSARGRADIAVVAQYLAKQHISVDQVFHSTLTRARQTAEILAANIAHEPVVSELSGIEPWGNVQAFAERAAKWEHDTMICGHEPFLGEAASLLMCGDAHAGLVEVKTGAVMAFDHDTYGSGWHLRWMLTPRLVRGPKVMEDEE